MLSHHAPRLFRSDPRLAEVEKLAPRLYDLVGYLSGPARLPASSLATVDKTPVAVHRFCQASNVLGRANTVERLLIDLCDIESVPLYEADVCCGFGGSVSVTAPEVSAGILERKLENVAATGAGILVTDNPGCILHLRGGVDARGLDVQVVHLAEYLAARLK